MLPKTGHPHHPKTHRAPSTTQTLSPSSSSHFLRSLRVSLSPDPAPCPMHPTPTSCLLSTSHHTISCTSSASHPPSADLACLWLSPLNVIFLLPASLPPLSWPSSVSLPAPRKFPYHDSASISLPRGV